MIPALMSTDLEMQFYPPDCRFHTEVCAYNAAPQSNWTVLGLCADPNPPALLTCANQQGRGCRSLCYDNCAYKDLCVCLWGAVHVRLGSRPRLLLYMVAVPRGAEASGLLVLSTALISCSEIPPSQVWYTGIGAPDLIRRSCAAIGEKLQ
eukprot:scaffold254414_cov17-Tisochrysis_lutea.AAC.1